MSSRPDSLLVRITDFLVAQYHTLGAMLRFVPTHYFIMENVLCDRQVEREADKWETYDLKPIDYFYPERDLLPGSLRSQATLRRLRDVFEDKIRITKEQYCDLRRTIEEDTGFLQSVNTVDYSLFLVRFPAHLQPGNTNARTCQWREGVPSADGKWKYRTVLLDFFWAKHTLHAQALTSLVHTFNVVGQKGPMTITTTAEEYRQRFLQMIDGMVELAATST
ncbi:hypothetical protein VTN77DRAFT_6303 [Rasamsonia byssochlamydoides]|uniref:uncharacterized protein n=1 Tax=Rasamsonia byssochlamydoides TaxID=89139 RepID=UPI0037447C75